MELDPPTSSEPLLCAGCSQSLELLDRFCRHCGRPCAGKAPFHHRAWFVLVMLFAVVGPFALPLLWRSSKFSRRQKFAITILQGIFVWFLMTGIVRGYMLYLKFLSNLGI